VTSPGAPLKVDPTELGLTADRLDGHGSGFRAALETAQSRAGNVGLGSGLAAAALPGMLAAWEADGTRFDKDFATHAHGHREAANRYVRTDGASAGAIDGVGAAP